MLNMQIYIYMCMFLSLHTPKQPQEEVGSDMKVFFYFSVQWTCMRNLANSHLHSHMLLFFAHTSSSLF